MAYCRRSPMVQRSSICVKKEVKEMFLMLLGIMFIYFGAAFLSFLFRLALYLSPIGLLMLMLRPRYRRYRRYYR